MLEVVIDADALASLHVRNLLITAARVVDNFQVRWSEQVLTETDAARLAMAIDQGRDPATVPPIRQALANESQSALIPDPLANVTVRDTTDLRDIHLLQAAWTIRAPLILTRNVRDLGEHDLAAVRASATQVDLFLASRLSTAEYRAVVAAAAGLYATKPSIQSLHATFGAVMPRLDRYSDELGVQVLPHQKPAEPAFRGKYCVRCGRPLINPASLRTGLGPECRRRPD